MARRLTFNEVTRLASQIEGAELIEQQNGEFVIKLNAIKGESDEALLEPATIYNKTIILLAEVPQAVQERITFRAGSEDGLKGEHTVNSYKVFSQGCLICQYDKTYEMWISNNPLESEEYKALASGKRSTFKRHVGIVNEALGITEEAL